MQAEVSAARDFATVMRVVTKTAMRLMNNAEGAAVALVEGDQLRVHEGQGTLLEFRGLTLALDESLAMEVLTTGKPAIIEDASIDERVDPVHFEIIQARSIIIVPVPFMGRAIGTLTFHCRRPFAFDTDDLLVAQLLAGPLAIGFSAARGSQAEAELSTQHRRFAATFEQAAVGIAHVAPDGRYIAVNDRFCAITGHDRKMLMASDYQSITHPDDLLADMDGVRDLLSGKIDTHSIDKRYIRPDGSVAWGHSTVSLVRDEEDVPEFFVGVLEDINARKRAEAAAMNDALTGLPNRRGVEARLLAALAGNEGKHEPLAIVYMDLDGFKAINDRYGHAEGDRCLVEVGVALRKAAGVGGFVGRWGGDEFFAILECPDEELAHELVQQLRSAVDRLASEEGWRLSISAGVLFIPGGKEKCRLSVSEIVKLADQLMYVAKQTRSDGMLVETFSAGRR
ncbi:diguanylate cyclase [Aurantiacibacter sp. MUD11]|nr:diguanylate cyclase [Aurantiacibacter sp. MUD11]WAT16945.1 diguanylate cyclase [Aurantiacibacter sp. MUD11]